MDTMDTLMSAIVEEVAIRGLTWAPLTLNKLALQTALNILSDGGEIRYFKWKIRHLEKQLTEGKDEDEEKDENKCTCTCGERETDES